MRISIFGAGYVGLVTGACLAEKGNQVICYDINKEKIDMLKLGKIPIHEEGLESILEQVTKSSSDTPLLKFSSDAQQAVKESDLIFLTVGTPLDNRKMNLEYLWNATEDIVNNLDDKNKIVIVKSTVPVGTSRDLQNYFCEKIKNNVFVVSNPEFLVEGKAVEGMKRPDRIIIGTDTLDEVKHTFDELYGPFLRKTMSGVRYMSTASAELSKLAANAYLATRISFINEIANFAEIVGADIEEVRIGIGSDSRIGMHYLYPGQGFGGSCFPKDLPTLIDLMRSYKLESTLLEGVYVRNELQKKVLANKVISRFSKERIKGLKFGLWGMAFKAETDDVRGSPAIELIKILTEKGTKIIAYDPRANENARRELNQLIDYRRLEIVDSQYGVISGSDALIISTEWDIFRSPDFGIIRKGLKNPIIFDGRNLYDPGSMEKKGFEYYPIGRKQITQSK